MNIKIKPEFNQYIAENILLIFIFFGSALFIGYNDIHIQQISIIVSIITLIVLMIHWLQLQFTSWEISTEQIIYKRGIISRHIDYLELYRVIDFKEKQSLLQQILVVKTITITTGDKSHPELKIFGVKEKYNLTDIIRSRVEMNKQTKRVYEISNR